MPLNKETKEETKGLLKELEDLEISGTVETIQTTALFAVTQTPVRVHRRTLMWKNHGVNNNNNNNNNNNMENEGDDYTNGDWCIRYSN